MSNPPIPLADAFALHWHWSCSESLRLCPQLLWQQQQLRQFVFDKPERPTPLAHGGGQFHLIKRKNGLFVSARCPKPTNSHDAWISACPSTPVLLDDPLAPSCEPVSPESSPLIVPRVYGFVAVSSLFYKNGTLWHCLDRMLMCLHHDNA